MPDSEPNLRWSRPGFFTTWTVMWLAVWCGLFVLTHIPIATSVSIPQGGDKVIHLVAYFVLALLGGRSAISRGVAISSGWLITWLTVYAIYGAADELLQGPVNRSPSLMDWVADVCGAGAALGIMYVNRGRPEDRDEPAPPTPSR